MIDTSMIAEATKHTDQLSAAEIAALQPIVYALGTWQRLNFSPCDQDDYRRACRNSTIAGVGDDLAKGLIEGRIAEAIEEAIEALDPRDRKRFREAFAEQIAASKLLAR